MNESANQAAPDTSKTSIPTAARRPSGTTLYRLGMLTLMTLVAWPQIDNLLSGRGLSTVAVAGVQANTPPAPATAAIPAPPTFGSVYPNGGITLDAKVKATIPVVYVVNLPDIVNNNRTAVLEVRDVR